MNSLINERSFWFNTETGEYEYTTAPTTDEQALKHLPQHPSAKTLYRVLRKYKKMSIAEAMIDVLTAAVGRRE